MYIFFFIFSACHLCFLRAFRVVSLACSKPKRALFPFFFCTVSKSFTLCRFFLFFFSLSM